MLHYEHIWNKSRVLSGKKFFKKPSSDGLAPGEGGGANAPNLLFE